MKAIAILRLVRWPNLLIVALTQYLLQYLLLVPAFQENGLSPTLPDARFLHFVITTMLIAAAGYIINDIVDYEIDLVNKPGKVIINRSISSNKAMLLYYSIFITGLAIAFYLAVFVGNLLLVLIYPAAFGLLWLYAHFLKKMPLAGNLVVALFCAFVAGVVLFAEKEPFADLLQINREKGQETGLLFGGYILFAFLSTMLREIAKDIEDMQGDVQSNCRTLPIVFGIKTAKIWAAGFAIVLLAFIIAFSQWLWENGEYVGLAFTAAGIVLPLLYCLCLLKNAVEKKEYTGLSKLSKFIMVTGLLLLILIWKF